MRCGLSRRSKRRKFWNQEAMVKGFRIDIKDIISSLRYTAKTKLLENVVRLGHTYSNHWQSKNNTIIKASKYRSIILVNIIIYKINKIILQNKTSQTRMIDFLLLVLNTRNRQFQLRKDLFQLWSKVGGFHVKEEYDGRESLLSSWWENRETPEPIHILQRTFKDPTLYTSTTSKWCIQILKPSVDYSIDKISDLMVWTISRTVWFINLPTVCQYNPVDNGDELT